MRDRDPWWTGRSTVELMVLAFTVTICLAILLAGGAIVLVEMFNPDSDTSSAVSGMSDVISMILGALLGLLAGRADLGRPPDGPTGNQ